VQKWSQRSSPKNKSKEKSQFAKTFWRSKMTFWAVSPQVMKHGSTNTTLKRSGKVHNGRMPILHDRKSSVSPNQESKQCCCLFDIRGTVHGKTVNQVYYLDVLKCCVKKLDGKDPNVLPTTHGSCITTKHLLTRHYL